jgi:hypothetical protein
MNLDTDQTVLAAGVKTTTVPFRCLVNAATPTQVPRFSQFNSALYLNTQSGTPEVITGPIVFNILPSSNADAAANNELIKGTQMDNDYINSTVNDTVPAGTVITFTNTPVCATVATTPTQIVNKAYADSRYTSKSFPFIIGEYTQATGSSVTVASRSLGLTAAGKGFILVGNIRLNTSSNNIHFNKVVITVQQQGGAGLVKPFVWQFPNTTQISEFVFPISYCFSLSSTAAVQIVVQATLTGLGTYIVTPTGVGSNMNCYSL